MEQCTALYGSNALPAVQRNWSPLAVKNAAFVLHAAPKEWPRQPLI